MKKIIYAFLFFSVACTPPKQKGLIFFNDFESIKGWASVCLSKKVVHSGIYSNQLDSTHVYGESFKAVFKEISEDKVVKVKVSFWTFMNPDAQGDLVVEIKKPDLSTAMWTAKKLSEIAPKIGKWQEVQAEFTFPDSALKSVNTICIYPWNVSKGTFYVDDFRLEFVQGY